MYSAYYFILILTMILAVIVGVWGIALVRQNSKDVEKGEENGITPDKDFLYTGYLLIAVGIMFFVGCLVILITMKK